MREAKIGIFLLTTEFKNDILNVKELHMLYDGSYEKDLIKTRRAD